MKYILIFVLSFLMLTSCSDDIGTSEKFDVGLQHGDKTYSIKKVTIDEFGTYIYVVYPNDSTELMPVQTTTPVRSGKHTKNVTTVILK